ncbi:hypothetical protein IAD21_04760 [Abditibacteriota bacterium]|nr:hypothetical protein IAD21_04760 [Abditibacteriota bacterium]
MWANLGKLIANLIDVAKGTKKNSEDIKKLNQQVTDLTNLVLALGLKFEHSKEMSEAERKNLLLELENILLRNGLQVPPKGLAPPSLPPSNEPPTGDS